MTIKIIYNNGAPEKDFENVTSFVIQNCGLLIEPNTSDTPIDLNDSTIAEIAGF